MNNFLVSSSRNWITGDALPETVERTEKRQAHTSSISDMLRVSYIWTVSKQNYSSLVVGEGLESGLEI